MCNVNFKSIVLLLGLLLLAAWCGATGTCSSDGHSHIQIKEAAVQDTPRGSSIHASIDGHTLTIAFSQNIGQVDMEVTTADGVRFRYETTPSPNGLSIYIPQTGDYIVTFTLDNGDEYYGEFSVTD